MKNSENIRDFVQRLGKHVCSEESSEELAYFAMLQAFYVGGFEVGEIMDCYSDSLLIRPYYLKKEEKLRALDAALAANLPDWIRIHLHEFRWLNAADYSVGSVIEDDALDKIDELIRNNNDLICFEPLLLHYRGQRYENEGKTNEAIECYEYSLELCQEQNDVIFTANESVKLAYVLRNFDARKAIEYLDTAEAMSAHHGYSSREWAIPNIRAGCHNTRGEFDLAIRYYLEALERLSQMSVYAAPRFLAHNLSSMFIRVGKYDDALEWANMALDSVHFISTNPTAQPSAHLKMANALIRLGRIDESKSHLDIARSSIMKLGKERALLELYSVEGLLERTEGNSEASMDTARKNLEISERIHLQHWINHCLLELAELEVMQFTHFDNTMDNIGPWLSLLEETSRERDFPGYLGLALILKAKLRLNQGRTSNAYRILRKAIEISKNPGTQFLKEKIASLVQTSFPEHVRYS